MRRTFICSSVVLMQGSTLFFKIQSQIEPINPTVQEKLRM